MPLAVNPDLQIPYSHQWNATVEHERWNTGFRLSYVATLGREMWYTRDANAPAADGQLYVNKPRPFPQYPDIIYADNGGSHDYHGVTVEAERRFSKGLFFQMAYTAARDQGDTCCGPTRSRTRSIWARARSGYGDAGTSLDNRGDVRSAVRP